MQTRPCTGFRARGGNHEPYTGLTEDVLDRHHHTHAGARVRLRLPLVHDAPALDELLARLGLATGELEARRALRWAPRRRVALCATAWDGRRESLVGFAALDCGPDRATVLADEERAPGVRVLLEAALAEQAQTWGRRVA